MPTPQTTQLMDEPKRETQPSHTNIEKQVLSKLGRPEAQHRVQIRQLWPDHYRVNIFVGLNASIRIAHSYFLVTDGDGKVLTSTPAITRQY